MEKIRIQKMIADSGYCSRRKAEELISKGRVKLNGHPVKLGDKCGFHDLITIDGERIYMPRKRNFVYIMMNKPRGYVTTVSDELDRRCVMDLLEGVEERVYPIGRLDRNSEGLLLFTNDGEFANSIMHPSRHIAKTYRVTVRPDISDEQLVQLSSGVEIDGRKTLPANVVVKEKQHNCKLCDISPKNRCLALVISNGGEPVVKLCIGEPYISDTDKCCRYTH